MEPRHAQRVLLLSVLAILASCGPAVESVTPAAPTPTPRGFDLTAWDVSTIGNGPLAVEANGGVDLFFPANTRGDLQQQNLIAVKVTSRCHLAADFDLRVDYVLATWPVRNGVRFGLAAGPDSVARTSDPVGTDYNTYATNFSGTIVQLATSDMIGHLRLARVGTTVTGFYLSQGAWVSIASAAAPAGTPTFSLQAWTDGYTFSGRDVRVNLKNVTMTGCS